MATTAKTDMLKERFNALATESNLKDSNDGSRSDTDFNSHPTKRTRGIPRRKSAASFPKSSTIFGSKVSEVVMIYAIVHRIPSSAAAAWTAKLSSFPSFISNFEKYALSQIEDFVDDEPAWVFSGKNFIKLDPQGYLALIMIDRNCDVLPLSLDYLLN